MSADSSTDPKAAGSIAADGERSAASGYGKQYDLAAFLIRRAAESKILQAVHIGDPNVGIFDDIVLQTSDSLWMHQVKTTESHGQFRLKTQLLNVIPDIAASWKKILAHYPTKAVRCTYIFDKSFHQSGKIADALNDKKAVTTSDFVDRFNNKRHTAYLLKDVQLQKLFVELREASGLDENDFGALCAALQLEDRSYLDRHSLSSLGRQDQEVAKQISDLIQNLTRRTPRKVIWSADAFFSELNLPRSPSGRFVHQFPTNSDDQRNDATIAELKKTIEEVTQGYIGVIGPPGTGKSTLLARNLAPSPHRRVVRYLAFLPNQRHGYGRAEASNFLADVSTGLEEQGLSSYASGLEGQINLQDRFAYQLKCAGEDFAENQRKTVIIVDGLDHIPREESPDRSLLAELPLPTTLPEGVVIILGTQSLELDKMPRAVTQQASKPGRSIVMQPLSKSRVFAFARQNGISEDKYGELLFERTQGHPLSLRYYMAALKAASSPEDMLFILVNKHGLGETLDDIYCGVWQHMKMDASTREVIGMIARAQGTIFPLELEKVYSAESIELALQCSKPLLTRSPSGGISLWHNSFRLFAIAETSKRYDEYDEALDLAFYEKLAKIAETSKPGSDQLWQDIRYLSLAGKKQDVLQRATRERFRGQVAEGRLISDIHHDLQAAYGALEGQRNTTILTRLLLLSKEMLYRQYVLEDLNLAESFLARGQTALAVTYTIDRGVMEDALLVIEYLLDQGDTEKARRVFEACEPLEDIFSTNAVRVSGQDNFGSWLLNAHSFYGHDHVLEVINGIEVNENPHSDPVEEVRQWYRHEAASAFLQANPKFDIDELLSIYNLPEDRAFSLRLELIFSLFRNERYEEAANALSSFLSNVDIATLEQPSRIGFIAAKLGLINEAKAVFSVHADGVLRTASDHEFQEERLRRSLEQNGKLAECVTRLGLQLNEVPKTKNIYFGLAVKNVVELGKLAGNCHAHRPPEDLFLQIRNWVDWFANARDDTNSYSSHEAAVRAALPWIYKTCLRLLKEYASYEQANFFELIEAKIDDGKNPFAWSLELKLLLAEDLARLLNDKSRCKKILDTAYDLGDASHTPQEFIEHALECATSYHQLGFETAADEIVAEAFLNSLGYWLRPKKDAQYYFWREIFETGPENQPTTLPETLPKYAQFLLGCEDTEGRGTAQRVINELMKASVRCPSYAASLIDRLGETTLIEWSGLVDSVLLGAVSTGEAPVSLLVELYAALALPIAGASDLSFVEALAKQGGNVAPACFDYLIRAAEIDAQKTVRREVLKLAGPFCSLPNEELSSIRTVLDDELEEQTKEKDHDRSGINESAIPVTKDFANKASLTALLEESGASRWGPSSLDYDYERRASDLARHASLSEIRNFYAQRPALRNSLLFHIAAAKRGFELGDTSYGLQMIANAEKMPSVGRRDEYYGDNGFALLELKITYQGGAAFNENYDRFLSDLASNAIHIDRFLPSLRRLLELISTDNDWLTIWDEVAAYLAGYREIDLAEPLVADETVASLCELLSRLIVRTLEFPAPQLRDMGRQAVLALGRGGATGHAILSEVCTHLSQGPEGRREVVALLGKISRKPNPPEICLQYANELLNDDDIVVSRTARSVLHNLGIRVPEAEQTDVPAYYKLIPSGTANSTDFKPQPGLRPQSNAVSVGDPWTFTSVLKTQVHLLSQQTGYSVEMLRRRCAQFMERSEGGLVAFGREAEAAQTERMKRLGLKIGWRRLQPMAAVRAIGQVYGELDRAGELDPYLLDLIWKELGGTSRYGFEAEVVRRPTTVPDLPKPDFSYEGDYRKSWAEQEQGLSYVPHGPNKNTLAEFLEGQINSYSEKHVFKRYNVPFEFEHFQDGFPNGIPRLNHVDDFYPLYPEDDMQLIAIISDEWFGELDNAVPTLCPYLMQRLFWERSNENPFVVVDQQGIEVARTVIWRDGRDQGMQGGEKNWFSSGAWLHVTDDALAKIDTLYGVRPTIQTYTWQSFSSSGDSAGGSFFNGDLQ